MGESAQAGLWFLDCIDRVNRAIAGTVFPDAEAITTIARRHFTIDFSCSSPTERF